MSGEVIRTHNFVAEAADFILNRAGDSLGERSEFRIALSGGNTPGPVYREVARRGHDLPWERIIFTFGDERCVPPDDPQSNYRMAKESWFDPAGVPTKSVMRMRGEIEPTVAGQEYEAALDLAALQRGERLYRHDLILLGMGDDGHTASLFPGTTALDEDSRRVVANFVPKFDAWRLTFTYPLINHARHVCFLIDERKHAELIEKVLGGDQQFPAARVNPSEGQLTWILGQ